MASWGSIVSGKPLIIMLLASFRVLNANFRAWIGCTVKVTDLWPPLLKQQIKSRDPLDSPGFWLMCSSKEK